MCNEWTSANYSKKYAEILLFYVKYMNNNALAWHNQSRHSVFCIACFVFDNKHVKIVVSDLFVAQTAYKFLLQS